MKTMIAMMVLMVGLNAVPASAESTDAFSNDVEDSINKANAISAEVMAQTKLSLGLIALGFDRLNDLNYFFMYFHKSGGNACGITFTIHVFNHNLIVDGARLLSAKNATDFLLKTQNLELIKTQISEIKKVGLLQIKYADLVCKEAIRKTEQQERAAEAARKERVPEIYYRGDWEESDGAKSN